MNEPTLHQGYSRAELDAQYDNRSMVPEHVGIHAAFEADGEAVLSDYNVRLDIPFGPSPEETLDIYLPDRSASDSAPGAAPVNVFLHGGYWYSRHKNDFRFLARGLVSSGAILVVVNYALVPSVDLDELVRQCRAAVAWTYANAQSFGGDGSRIYVSGHSAGGHLTAMMMATDWPAFGDGLPSGLIRGGAALSGIYDLAPISMTFLQETLGFTPDQISRNSPEFLPPLTDAPLIIGVGGDESDEFRRQSEALSKAWGEKGTDCSLMVLPGINHFTILGVYADPESALTRAVLKQMGLG